jgi:hypothetical protein
MVRVVVGEDIETSPQTFFVHADLLISRSTFFQKALRSYAKADRGDNEKAMQIDEFESIQWREGEEGIVKLPVDEPEVFTNYMQLLYAGVLPIFDDPQKPKVDPKTMTEDEIKKAETNFDKLVHIAVTKVHTMLGKLYVFCEKIRDATGKQTLSESFIKECSEVRATGSRYYALSSVVTNIYSGTLPSDPFRAFLVDCFAYVGHSGWISGNTKYDDYPHEFLFDATVEFHKARPGPQDRSRVNDTKYYLDKLNESEKEEMEADPENMQVE